MKNVRREENISFRAPKKDHFITCESNLKNEVEFIH